MSARTGLPARTRRSFIPIVAALLVAATTPGPAAAHHSRYERLSAGAVNGNGAIDATFRGASTDGSRVFFETAERLVAADTDLYIDVYERFRGTTRRVSAGAVNGNGPFHAFFAGASGDGRRVFFHGDEELAADDADAANDIYERLGGITTLVSAGTVNGNGDHDAVFRGASSDGTKVFFDSDEALVAADTDAVQDVYRRSGGKTARISAGAVNGNGAAESHFVRASNNGGRVFFWTTEPLTADDTDSYSDVYERSGEVTTRISIGAVNGNGAFGATFAGASDDGTRVFFATYERLVPADVDASYDVYQRFGGTTRRISAGVSGGNGPYNAGLVGTSSDGTRAFFVTSEPLVASDTDASQDVYQRTGSVTTLISAGSVNGNGNNSARFEDASSDGTRVFFSTSEPLVAEDIDTASDIYERVGGTTRRISTGTGGMPSFFAAASDDGTRVFFVTYESLVASDTDAAGDIYERTGNTTSHVSPGNAPSPSLVYGLSGDGSALFYMTAERVIADDSDSALDVYGAYQVP